jgi:hypothetical protein
MGGVDVAGPDREVVGVDLQLQANLACMIALDAPGILLGLCPAQRSALGIQGPKGLDARMR